MREAHNPFDSRRAILQYQHGNVPGCCSDVKTRDLLNCPPQDDSAFTRTDLLAVLAALSLLATVALPSLGLGTEKTKIAQCAANLQKYDLSFQIFGNENQGQLPVNASGSWAWDTASPVVTYVTNTGVRWNELYCPGTSVRFSEQDNLRLFNYAPSSFSVLGYAATLPGNASFVGAGASNVNTSLTVQRVFSSPFNGQLIPVQPASRPLVADATLNNTGNSSLYSAMIKYNWINIDGGYVNAYGQVQPHLSAHLSGLIPLGGNIGMLDGHVEWRNFNQMVARTGSSPYFYW